VPRHLKGYLYLSLAMMTVGSTVIASKLIAAGLPPFTATALRFALALPLFLLIMRATGTAWPKPGGHDRVILFLQAAAGSVGYTALLITGLRFTSAANASVVIGTLPIVSAAIAVVVLRERPHLSLLAAIGLAAVGVLSITVHPGEGDSSTLGSVLILGAVFCEGIFILLNKRLRAAIPPLAQSTLMAAIGLAVAVVAALFEMPFTADVSNDALLAVAFYALVPTVAGFLLWYAGAALVSGAEAALFTAVAPVSAVIFAATVLAEPVAANQIVGIGLVLAAVLSLALRRTAGGPDRPA
jgi:drug/metabolite transporter (DMT)-like permease